MTGCTSAGIGCIDCKKALHKNLMKVLDPIGERTLTLPANGRKKSGAAPGGECGEVPRRGVGDHARSQIEDGVVESMEDQELEDQGLTINSWENPSSPPLSG